MCAQRAAQRLGQRLSLLGLIPACTRVSTQLDEHGGVEIIYGADLVSPTVAEAP
jgi:hypothetical protein